MTQCFLQEDYKLEEKGEHTNQSVWYREIKVDGCVLNDLGKNKQNRNNRKKMDEKARMEDSLSGLQEQPA